MHQLAPKNKNIYNKNTKAVIQEISQINSWIKVRLASIPAKNRKLITTNSAMIYYFKAYDIPYSVNLDNVKNMEKLAINGLGEPGTKTETYQKMIRANTRVIVESLGGTYLRFYPTNSQK